MKKRLIWFSLLALVLLLGAMQVKQAFPSKETFSKVTIRYGDNGKDVRELQGRLKLLGFYKGKVDGDFGYSTLKALKTFQWKFGMEADGRAGAQTKLKLWKATKHYKPTAEDLGVKSGSHSKPTKNSRMTMSNHLGLSANDLRIMANAVHGEARGESYEGQVAVAAVILNRVKSPSFPKTVSGVIFEPRAFTAVADGQIWLEPNDQAKRAVQDAINGWDPTGGCIYYFNPVTATSPWIWTRPQVKTIGKHIFCM